MIPISARVKAILTMAKTDPAGEDYPVTAFVFGDEAGQQVKSIRKAWATAVLKAHGVTPVWTSQNQLTPEARAQYEAIDLHFHDLRHEAASRWLEAGVPLHHIQELLGHADLTTTSTYLNAGKNQLHESIARFDALRAAPAAADKKGKKKAKRATREHPPLCLAPDGTADKPLVN